MNFIVIMSDTLRPDHLAAYGSTHCQTPASAEFARTAAVFDNSWVGSFPTIPNRTDLFTGRFGEPFHPWLPLSFSDITVVEILREAGWVTQLMCDTPHLVNGGHAFDWPFHAWQFFRGNEVDRYGMDSDPVELPFQDASKVQAHTINKSFCQFVRNARERHVEEDWTGCQTFQAAINWLERNTKHGKFFLWIDGFDPHEPNLPPRKYEDLYDPGYTGDRFVSHIPDPSKLTEAEIRNIKARYSAMVTLVDRQVGRLLQTLEDLRLADNTCMVWVSDHGTYLNEHNKILTKTAEFNEVARTVMMIRTPDRDSAGKHFTDLVQPADLAPTLLELAGLPVPPFMQGRSYLSLLRGGSWTSGRDVALTFGGLLSALRPFPPVIARDARWQLNDTVDPSKRVLYDVQNDPGQTRNVAAQHPGEVERLHRAVVEFLKTHDAQPQIVRLFETGNPGDMTGYVDRRPGCERFHAYFQHILNSHVLPEPAERKG
ncbi:MAG: sulfatase [Candidatus Sumerlaeota bacterium]|nr:sulfatase [Candidatus Sumerlaeota bacterium]